MFCSKCGSQITEGSGFCPSCGTPANPQSTTASKESQSNVTQPAVSSAPLPSATQQTIGMIWYYFSILVALAVAIYSIIDGIKVLNGHTYMINGVNKSKIFYMESPILRGLDIFYAVVCFGSAILAAYCIYLVLARKKKAPSNMSAVFGPLALGIFIYDFFRTQIVSSYPQLAIITALAKKEFDYTKIIIVYVVMLAFMIVSKILFKKIKHIFVN
ncbi:MAG: zinc ribbon domain-containing protein [Ruminococcaceae bacterium]|nr:zinc ribbon domain-containing protein [Oscillospiraceae bacterium]